MILLNAANKKIQRQDIIIKSLSAKVGKEEGEGRSIQCVVSDSSIS